MPQPRIPQSPQVPHERRKKAKTTISDTTNGNALSRPSPSEILQSVKTPFEPVIDEHGVHIIFATGDIILDITHNEQSISFRVDRSRLRDASPYFRNLLHESAYNEGRLISDALAKLNMEGETIATLTSDHLPHIAIDYIGCISPVKSLVLLLTDFFRLLHGEALTNPHPPLTNLCNLTVVADRFDSLDALKHRAHTDRLFRLIDARSDSLDGPKTSARPEHMLQSRSRGSGIRRRIPLTERFYQRIYLSLKLDHPPWLASATQYLIQIVDLSSASVNDNDYNDEAPAWFTLPSQLEAELVTRRAALITTLNSALQFFLDKYTSGVARQCKLGYDSSAACDSFQLGEMVRFLLRVRAAQMSFLPVAAPFQPSSPVPSAFPSASQPFPFPLLVSGNSSSSRTAKQSSFSSSSSDLAATIDTLRQVPNYQVDGNHHHCGLRARLLPALKLVEAALLHAGVCGECWAGPQREGHAWARAKGPLVWRVEEGSAALLRGGPGRKGDGGEVGVGGQSGCAGRHLPARDFCLASHREWEVERSLQ